jgi:Protein of unknown function (DUF2442)
MTLLEKNHKWSNEELKSIAQAKVRGEAMLADSLQAVSAKYDLKKNLIVVHLTNGANFSFPPHLAQGLKGAKDADLKIIQLSPQGTGLHWPRLSVDLSVTGLLSGVFGSRNWTSQQAAKAGRAKTEAKAVAARLNGAKGGRPKSLTKGLKITSVQMST